jgi:Ser/Thr protein kinase RdoA (MazF antagonist)
MMSEFGAEKRPDDEPQEPQHTHEDLLDLNEVMHAFGVDTWQNLGPLEPSLANNLSLLVAIQGERYVLRERPEVMLGEDSSHRYAFHHYLQQEGIPVPALRTSATGEPFVTLGEEYFELQQWPAGEQFVSSDPRSLDWIDFAAAMLARIHLASRRYTGHRHQWPSEAHIGGIVQGYLNLARSKSETIEMQMLSSALAQWVEQWEVLLPAAMISIGAGGRGIPEFHIHGDYHALNLRFGSSGVTAVMGLEASRWEKRIFEVAYALFYFSALTWLPGEKLTRPLVKRGFDPERARRFLKAYGEIYPPERGEALLLADALLLVSPIASVNGPLEDLFYDREMNEATPIDDLLERLSWATSLPAWLTRVRRSLPEMWEAAF